LLQQKVDNSKQRSRGRAAFHLRDRDARNLPMSEIFSVAATACLSNQRRVKKSRTQANSSGSAIRIDIVSRRGACGRIFARFLSSPFTHGVHGWDIARYLR
jgi:hypothetical protein